MSLPPSYGNPFMGLTAPANGGFFGMFQPYPQDNAVAVTPFEPPPLPPYNTGGGNMGYQQPATVGGNGVMLAPQGFLLPALFGPYSQMNNFQPPTYGGGGVG